MKIIEETYKWARTNWKEQTPDEIVIHHALSPNCTAQDIHRWHLEKGWKGIAYHFVIRKDGSIYRGRKENHVGGGLLGSENNNKLQICLEGVYTDYKNLTEKEVPEAQLAALFWIINDLKLRWGIDAIKKHADYPSAIADGHKDCPGKYFPWDKLMSMMGAMTLVKFQKAARYIGFYDYEIDNKPGKLTKAAAEEFLKITLEILGLRDPRNIIPVDIGLQNDMRLIKELANKW